MAQEDAALLSAIASGDGQAFSAFFERHHERVYRFARQMGAPRVEAEDVTQDVFVALITGAGRFNPGLGTVVTYLYGITRNILRQRLRKAAPDRRGELMARGLDLGHQQASDVFLSVARQEAVSHLRMAIAELPTQYREVVVLCELHELSYEDAARVVGCPVGTIRSRLSRARRALAARCGAALGEKELGLASPAVPSRRCTA